MLPVDADAARGRWALGDPAADGFARAMGLVRRLRAPGGCPWDREQTHASLRRFVLEEAREVVCAVDGGDAAALCDELGDLLLQVCLHSAIAEESGAFTAGDVTAALAAKLIRRHPHVFGEAEARDPAAVERLWAAVKAAEVAGRRVAGEGTAWLDQVSRDLPPLAEAAALGARAAECGLDFAGADEAWTKVEEERAELLAAWEGAGRHPDGSLEEELGDLLFSLVQLGRQLGVDAELALLGANRKFRRRFGAVEAGVPGGPEKLRALGAAELDAAWRRAKEGERGPA
jgi:MazG family protein